MPQTLFAVLALALAALLAFSQQQSTIQSYEQRLRNEYSVAASGLLVQIMELNAARSFDEASTPGWIRDRQRLPTVNDFTPPEHFGRYDPLPGQGRGLALGIERKRDDNFNCDLLKPANTPICSDVDDVAGIEWQEVEVALGNGHTMRFEVSLEVEYVHDSDPTAIVDFKTNNKLVTIRARTPERPQLGEIVRLERIVAYDPVKAEAEYELLFGPLMDEPVYVIPS